MSHIYIKKVVEFLWTAKERIKIDAAEAQTSLLFIPCIIFPCQSLAHVLPTKQLDSWKVDSFFKFLVDADSWLEAIYQTSHSFILHFSLNSMPKDLWTGFISKIFDLF